MTICQNESKPLIYQEQRCEDPFVLFYCGHLLCQFDHHVVAILVEVLFQIRDTNKLSEKVACY